MALSLTLLSRGLFIRSLDVARQIDLASASKHAARDAAPTLQGYDFEKRLAFSRRRAIASAHSCVSRCVVQFPPLGIIGEAAEVAPEPRPSDPDWRLPLAAEADISPEYFETVRTRLIEGRVFDARDRAGSTPVVIINQTLAQEFWPRHSPLGRTLIADGNRVEVVGVVQNGKYQNVGEAPRGAIFRPVAQTSPVTATVAIRTVRFTHAAGAARFDEPLAQADPEVAVTTAADDEHLDTRKCVLPLPTGGVHDQPVWGVWDNMLASSGFKG